MSAGSLPEKYRPQKLDEIVGQPQAVSIIKNLLERGFSENVLFCGPSGTGKTTAAKCIKEKFVELTQRDGDLIDGDFHEYNGREVTPEILTRIKAFTEFSGRKIILIDDAEGLSNLDQDRLRKYLEMPETTFILVCNEISKIQLPIKSRCIEIEFIPVSDVEIAKKLKEICLLEGFISEPVSPEIEDLLKKLGQEAKGDVRKAINKLQVYVKNGKLEPISNSPSDVND
jgi:replication factor C small subunit